MNSAAYQLATAAALRADGDDATADALMALSPDEVAAILLGDDPPATFAEWTPYKGPEGGIGWTNGREVRYQREKPDDDDGTGGGTDPHRQDIKPGIDQAARVLGGATVGGMTGAALAGPLGAVVGGGIGAAVGSDLGRAALGGVRRLLNLGEEPEGIARRVTAGDPEAVAAVREDAAAQARDAAARLVAEPPGDPAEVRRGWAQASAKMRAGDAAELGGHVEALATAREPDKVDMAFRAMGGFLGRLTGGALRLAFNAIKAFGRWAQGSGKRYTIWAASLATGAAVLAAPPVALAMGLITPTTMIAGLMGSVAATAVLGRVAGAAVKRAGAEDWQAHAEGPTPFAEWKPYTSPETGRQGWISGGGLVRYDRPPESKEPPPSESGQPPAGGGGAWSEESPYEPDRTRLDRVMGKADYLDRRVNSLLESAGYQGVRVGQLVKQINKGGTVYGDTSVNELAAVLADIGVEWNGEAVRLGPTGDAYGNVTPRFPPEPDPKGPPPGEPGRKAAVELAPALAAFRAAPEGSPVRVAIDNAVANASPAGHDAATPPAKLDPAQVRRFRYDLAAQHADMAAAGMLTPADDAAFVRVMGELGIKPLHAPGESKPFDPETMELDGPTVSSGTPVRVARRGWVGLYGDPATGNALTGKNWRRAKVERFAEAADYTPAGPDGKRAVELLSASQASGVKTLTEVADRAVRRLLMLPHPENAAHLFEDDELHRIAGALAGGIATADLLGRSRVRRRAEMAERRVQQFAERKDDPGPPGAPPRPGLTWKRETQRWVRKGADHAKELTRRAKDAPKELHAKVKSYVEKKYAKLEQRYGAKGAKAIMAASLLLLPVPVPGASFVPIALAEAVRAIGKGAAAVGFAEGEFASEEWVDAVVEFLTDLYAEAGEPAPAIDPAKVRAALERDEVDEDDVETFAESFADDPWHDFAEPVPAVEPAAAVDYFRRLVPTLADDPGRYGPMLARHAFTLAVATEQTLLQKVKDAILSGLRTGVDATADVQDVLDAAGVSPRNPSYSEMVVRTNVMDAYNTGATAEMQTPEMQEAFPCYEYLGILDSRTGDDHRPKIGRYYPSSRPFAEVRGPRVFSCRCSFRPVFRSEAADLIRAGKVERG